MHFVQPVCIEGVEKALEILNSKYRIQVLISPNTKWAVHMSIIK